MILMNKIYSLKVGREGLEPSANMLYKNTALTN